MTPAGPEPAPPTGPSRYLPPGQIAASAEPCTVSTILGSCVAVCLWDSVRRLGGMNHYLLPAPPDGCTPSPLHGAVAVPGLIEKLMELGAKREHLLAKVFGGAWLLADPNEGPSHLGARNADLALALLDRQGIPVVGGDVGDRRGRRLLFETGSGQTWIRRL